MSTYTNFLVTERRVPIPTTRNFRDIGGYPAANGAMTGWARVFRSDALAWVPPEGWRQLVELGVRTVYDLRSLAERDRHPSQRAAAAEAGIAIVELPVSGEAAEAPDLAALLRQSDDRAYWVDYVDRVYLAMIDTQGSVFAEVLARLSEPGALPAVIHCTGGKDRTGLVVALLLRLLGVERETVLDDYELTAEAARRRTAKLAPHLEQAGVNLAAVEPLLLTDRAVLANALDAIDRRFGSVEGYLARSGLPAGIPGRLRHLLLSAIRV